RPRRELCAWFQARESCTPIFLSRRCSDAASYCRIQCNKRNRGCTGPLHKDCTAAVCGLEDAYRIPKRYSRRIRGRFYREASCDDERANKLRQLAREAIALGDISS